MSLSKIGTPGATTSSTAQSTAAEATPKGPSKAPELPGLQSLRSKASTLLEAGTGVARRTGVLTAAAVTNMLVSGVEAGYHPAVGAGAAVGAQHPQTISGDGSEQAKAIGIFAAGVVGAVGLAAAGYKAYQYFAGKNPADTAAATPAAAPAGDVNRV